MILFKSIVNIFKGGNNAKGIEKSVSGRDEFKRGIIHSFPSIRERALSDIGSIRMLASACANERGGDSGEVSPNPIRRESRAQIDSAKKTVPNCRMVPI